MGDVGKGKTQYTMKLLKEAIELGFSSEITVVDMAPERKVVKGKFVGGRLFDKRDNRCSIKYLAPFRVETPRLTATTGEVLLSLIRINANRIKPLIEEYISAPTPHLFINDISMFLQSGSIDLIINAIDQAETFIANGYYGRYFLQDYGTGISSREQELMELLAFYMNILIKL